MNTYPTWTTSKVSTWIHQHRLCDGGAASRVRGWAQVRDGHGGGGDEPVCHAGGGDRRGGRLHHPGAAQDPGRQEPAAQARRAQAQLLARLRARRGARQLATACVCAALKWPARGAGGQRCCSSLQVMGSMPLKCIIKILPFAKSHVSVSVDSGLAAQHGSCPSRIGSSIRLLSLAHPRMGETALITSSLALGFRSKVGCSDAQVPL